MAEAIMSFTFSSKPSLHRSSLYQPNLNIINQTTPNMLRQCSNSPFGNRLLHQVESSERRSSIGRVNALPDWPLMTVLVQKILIYSPKEIITHKSIWHLNDDEIKNVYTLYCMFTCWGCCFFGAAKDPYYDSEHYRKDGGDGTGHWVYEKQEDIEETSREALWREELIEEIELKVGSLKELEEAGRKEDQLVNK